MTQPNDYPPALVEAMARGACRAGGAFPGTWPLAKIAAFVDRNWPDWEREIRAALTAAREAGWVCVPDHALAVMLARGNFHDEGPRGEGWPSEEMQAALDAVDAAFISGTKAKSRRAAHPTITRDSPVTAIHDPSLPVDAASILAALRSWAADAPLSDAQQAQIDADIFGIGFLVDGKRVTPERVNVCRPLAAPQSPAQPATPAPRPDDAAEGAEAAGDERGGRSEDAAMDIVETYLAGLDTSASRIVPANDAAALVECLTRAGFAIVRREGR